MVRASADKSIHKALYGRALERRSHDRPRMRWAYKFWKKELGTERLLSSVYLMTGASIPIVLQSKSKSK